MADTVENLLPVMKIVSRLDALDSGYCFLTFLLVCLDPSISIFDPMGSFAVNAA